MNQSTPEYLFSFSQNVASILLITLSCIDSIIETNVMLISRAEWVKEEAEYENRFFMLSLDH